MKLVVDACIILIIIVVRWNVTVVRFLPDCEDRCFVLGNKKRFFISLSTIKKLIEFLFMQSYECRKRGRDKYYYFAYLYPVRNGKFEGK